MLGALLYRLYVTVYFALVLCTSWEGNDALYESLYFLFYLPNLVVVEIVWRMQQRNNDFMNSFQENKIVIFGIILFLVTTSLGIFFLSWLPAIEGEDSIQSHVLAGDGS